MIGHGGIRSMMEGLHRGVPLVGIPIQSSQPYDLKRVVEGGAGEILPIPQLTEKNLLNAINKILQNYSR